jgi:hypothetical protein
MQTERDTGKCRLREHIDEIALLSFPTPWFSDPLQ